MRLEKDVTDKDKYGRLLRYIYVNLTEEEIGELGLDINYYKNAGKLLQGDTGKLIQDKAKGVVWLCR